MIPTNGRLRLHPRTGDFTQKEPMFPYRKRRVFSDYIPPVNYSVCPGISLLSRRNRLGVEVLQGTILWRGSEGGGIQDPGVGRGRRVRSGKGDEVRGRTTGER